MNDTSDNRRESRHLHSGLLYHGIALLIFQCTFLVFIYWQVYNVWKVGQVLTVSSQSQLPMVNQANKVQGNTQVILNDLLELAETNERAKAVVEKYGISKNQ